MTDREIAAKVLERRLREKKHTVQLDEEWTPLTDKWCEALVRAGRLAALRWADDVRVAEYQEQCPHCKRDNHPAMANRYRGYCSDRCEDSAVACRVAQGIRELEGGDE